MKNKKGFTLIELLAVIIILGILMIIAIPSVTKYISDSRKSAYVDTAKEITSGVRNLVNEGKLGMYDTGTTYYIPASCVKTEGANKSPYGEFDKAYVLVTYNGTGYNYYWVSRDETGQGVKEPKLIGELEESNIESDISDDYIKEDRPQEGKITIKVLSTDDCNTFGDGETVKIASIEIKTYSSSQLVKLGDDDVYIFKGGTPANYVNFNGETWRIIGIYGNNLKIIRSTPIATKKKYNNSTSDGNVWNTSALKSYLNTNYYNESLTDTASRNMIDNTIEWNIGATTNDANAITAYSNSKATKWKGIDTNDPGIGLIATYEYLYASGVSGCDIVLGKNGDYSSSCGIKANNWITSDYNKWTLSPRSNYSGNGLFIYQGGYISGDFVNSSRDVSPAIFLKSSVKIVSGDGITPESAYVLQ